MTRFEFFIKKHTVTFLAIIICFQCSNLKTKSLRYLSESKTGTKAVPEKTNLAEKPLRTLFFFDEQFTAGGFSYSYPYGSVVSSIDTTAKNGTTSILIALVANNYSGGAICRGQSVNLSPYRESAALRFWIKGQKGGEKASIGLVDESRSSRDKAVVRLPVKNYASITTEWQQVSIPLIDFSDRGCYWDGFQKAEIPCDIDWSRIAEARIEIKKNENQEFAVFMDDIHIEPNVIDPSRYKPNLTWDRRVETVFPPPSPVTSEASVVFFDGAIPGNGFTYVYGGKTASVLQKNALFPDQKILTCYLDVHDNSGVTVVLNNRKSVNLKGYRKNGGLVFWAKCGRKKSSLQVGFLDHRNDELRVQSRVFISQYGDITDKWKKFTIPLRHFSDIGLYWDEESGIEIESPINWNTIHEIRFSCSKNGSGSADSAPVVLYLDNISIVKDISESSGAEKYWNSFNSTESELILHDFNNVGKCKWFISKGSQSKSSYEIIDAPANAPAGISKCISVTYSLRDWCDIFCSYAENKSSHAMRNWTKHWGIRFLLYTEKMFQGITVQIADGGNEHYVANVGALKGWNDIIVPFREFAKFIYYQPENTDHNNQFDLNGVNGLAFKASGNNTSGTFIIANVRLTNDRESRSSFSAGDSDNQVIDLNHSFK